MNDLNDFGGKDSGNDYRGNGRPNVPKSLAREGYVVWFYESKTYLGFEWNESAREINEAYVGDSEHAIYFDTFAQAAISALRLTSPNLVLYSSEKGIPPKVLGQM